MDDPNRARLTELLSAAKALLASMDATTRTEANDLWKFSGYKQYARKYNQLVEALGQIEGSSPLLDHFNLEKIPGIGDTVPAQQLEIFQMVHANLSMLRSRLEQHLGKDQQEAENIRLFLQTRLRSAIFDRPENELAVQNAVEQLLIGRGLQRGDDYDREAGRVRVSIKEVVPDFVFPRFGLALEVKICKDEQRAKKLVDEINADISAYAKVYRETVFLVYDLGFIRDELEFRRGLEAAGKVAVVIVKH